MLCQLMLNLIHRSVHDEITVDLLSTQLCYDKRISDGDELNVEFIVTPKSLDMVAAIDIKPDILRATEHGLTFHACPYLSNKVRKDLTDTQFLLFVPWSNIASLSNYGAIAIKKQD
ncbi:MAG: hypothetical protein K0U21_00300 [Proteobacteria bacterium]|nr:hypothetical protein [Pseudomonadota bacterium]